MDTTIADRQKPIVIYVPGLYASRLTRGRHKSSSWSDEEHVWDPPTSVLRSLFSNKRAHSNLALPITWSPKEEDEDDDDDDSNQNDCNGQKGRRYLQDEDDIYASDCLYYPQAKLLDFFHALNDHDLIELHKIPWDWRRGLEEAEAYVNAQITSICQTAQQLQQQLQQQQQQNVILVTHSTGAMLSWPCLNQNPQWFKTWISVGGCIAAGSNILLEDICQGWNAPGAGFIKLIAKETFFTFPTMFGYHIVPGETFRGQGDSDFVAVSENGVLTYLKEDVIDYYNINDWEKYNLGIFGWKGKENVTTEERQHLEHTFAGVKRFRQKHFVRNRNDGEDAFLDNPRNDYDRVRIVCYGSESQQTHSAYLVNLKTNSVDVSKSYLMAPGDGTLWKTCWSAIPGNLKVEIVPAQPGSTHSSMLNDDKLLNLLMKECFPNKGKLSKATAVLNQIKLKRTISQVCVCGAVVGVLAVTLYFRRRS